MLVFTFYIFTIALAILSIRFAIGIFTERSIRPRRAEAPFGFGHVCAVFALFLIVGPLSAQWVYNQYVAKYVPKIDREIQQSSSIESNTDAANNDAPAIENDDSNEPVPSENNPGDEAKNAEEGDSSVDETGEALGGVATSDAAAHNDSVAVPKRASTPIVNDDEQSSPSLPRRESLSKDSEGGLQFGETAPTSDDAIISNDAKGGAKDEPPREGRTNSTEGEKVADEASAPREANQSPHAENAQGTQLAQTEIVDKFDLSPNVEYETVDEYKISSESPKDDNLGDVVVSEEDISKLHPLARMLVRASKTKYFPFITIVFFIAVVVVAPIVEEFVFRVTLQGYLEKQIWFPMSRMPELVENEALQKKEAKKRLAFILVFQALIFASLHVGTPEAASDQPVPLDPLVSATIRQIIAGVITLIVGVLVLKSSGAQGKHFGFNRIGRDVPSIPPSLPEILSQFWRGFCLTIYISPIILVVNLLAQSIFPDVIVAPIPIFIFALAEGFAYFHTRSFPTVVGMHVALNFGSFAILFATITQLM